MAVLCNKVISAAEKQSHKQYESVVLADEPIVFWRFGDMGKEKAVNLADGNLRNELDPQIVGDVKFENAGPNSTIYPLFEEHNVAARFSGRGCFLRVKDPGTNSPLDFDSGDSITLEAWVKPSSLADNQQTYIVGKGRTNNEGAARDNQNYALRLRGVNGMARLSFLFRDHENRAGKSEDFHRWNSHDGFLLDGYWHHVAVTYTFGDQKTIRGYIDGQEVKGTWDFGGPTDEAPVVDDDELWIGSSMGGNPSSTFEGLIDEVAIYRKALSADRIGKRYEANFPDPREAELADETTPTNAVLIEIYEGIPENGSWTFATAKPTDKWMQSGFGLVGTTKKYVDGLIHDRTNTFLVRVRTKRTIEPSTYELLLRAKGSARLYVDGRVVAQTKPLNRNASGHEEVPDLANTVRPGLVPLLPSHQEQVAKVQLDDQEHVFRLDLIVGGKGLRAELGEAFVGISKEGAPFTLLSATDPSPSLEIGLDEESWLSHAKQLNEILLEIDANNRKRSAANVDEFWQHRHEVAKREIAKLLKIHIPEIASDLPVSNDIDRFIGERLSVDRIVPAPLTDDYAFLRRASLDTVGVIPSRQEISQFINDKSEVRRANVIDRLLNDPRWADNWVSYWQDLLAENPGILKPKLNNTGPFRWWIYESFLDNKPVDQFASELIMMCGSKYLGGPAGFSMATQNDVPMAAKAQIVGKAFLGLEMSCARCHDAPFHSFKQKQLFHMAAMLDKKTIKLPETSTVPIAEGARQPAVEISLKPGDAIAPQWPFDEFASDELIDELVRDKRNDRERFAATVTSPRNIRFAKVIVNRIWQRWMGLGLVDPIDDWEGAEPSHPELLEYLARELVANNYDLKHIARLILNSHAYQREVLPTDPENQQLWAGQVRRRASAEQLVDSMFVAAGKTFNSEMLTLDQEGRRPVDTFLNLGAPRRAWEFTSLSNERDRPALALPMAQTIIDVLLVYGWRDSRPNPTSVRDEEPTMLQPLTIANSVAPARAVTLSEDSVVTEMCLDDQPIEKLVDRMYLQYLSRPPSKDEQKLFIELLSSGYADRVVNVSEPKKSQRANANAVSWSNHLSAKATSIKLEMERRVREGDPPTCRLQSEWRERAEDALWALLNSPEFIFIP